jgi:UDP-2,3-diacylglucosamine pyrophosphatase LpxH
MERGNDRMKINDLIQGNKKIRIISNEGEPFRIPKEWRPVLSRCEILVVIPDMHMYIHNSNLDNFKYSARSMLSFLKHLSSVKEEMSLEDKTLRIYQIGDLYEQRFPGLHAPNATGIEIRMSHPDYDQIINLMNGMRTHFLYGNHDFELRHFPGFRFAAMEGKVYLEHGFTPDAWRDFSNPNASLWEPGQLLFLKIREINQFFANLLIEAKFINKDEHFAFGVKSGKKADYDYPSETEYLKTYGHCLDYFTKRIKKNPDKEDIKICVIGHTHHPFLKTDVEGNRFIFIDAGAWTSGRSDFTVITNEEIALCCYER